MFTFCAGHRHGCINVIPSTPKIQSCDHASPQPPASDRPPSPRPNPPFTVDDTPHPRLDDEERPPHFYLLHRWPFVLINNHPMQRPTCTHTRVRGTNDALVIFYAVQLRILPLITRRLDADERAAIRPGCVYVWEERGPHAEVTGLGIERFTEGRHWGPSRVRDEFLFYYERFKNNVPNQPSQMDPFVKQTYSVFIHLPDGKRKWHLTAYFTQATVDTLGSVDDIPEIRGLLVPPGLFTNSRVIKLRKGDMDSRNSLPSTTYPITSSSYESSLPFSGDFSHYPSHASTYSAKSYDPSPLRQAAPQTYFSYPPLPPPPQTSGSQPQQAKTSVSYAPPRTGHDHWSRDHQSHMSSVERPPVGYVYSDDEHSPEIMPELSICKDQLSQSIAHYPSPPDSTISYSVSHSRPPSREVPLGGRHSSHKNEHVEGPSHSREAQQTSRCLLPRYATHSYEGDAARSHFDLRPSSPMGNLPRLQPDHSSNHSLRPISRLSTSSWPSIDVTSHPPSPLPSLESLLRPSNLPLMCTPSTSSHPSTQVVPTSYGEDATQSFGPGLHALRVGSSSSAPTNALDAGGAERMKLAPLREMRRSHPYRRDAQDDRALRSFISPAPRIRES